MPIVFPNPPVDVNALLAPMSPAIVKQVITDSLVSMGIRADLWPKEGVAISIITVVANVLSSAFNTTIIPAIRAGWLPTAAGAWLTWLALYMYGQSRVLATFATGQVTLSNALGGNWSFAPFTVTFQNSLSKATYTNLDAVALGPGPGATQVGLHVQATAQGSASNAQPGGIDTVVTTMLGVSVTNPAPVLGIDQQSDPSLQLQCWNSIAANSPFGAKQAIAWGIQTALNSVTQSPVNINRWTISPSSHTGTILVYVASPSGAADPNDVLGVAGNIDVLARPPCSQVTVLSASTVANTDTFTVYVRATPGLQQDTVKAAMITAVSTLFRGDAGSNPIGGITVGNFTGFYAAAVKGACYDAWPPKPTDPTVVWTSAVSDVVSANETAAALLGPPVGGPGGGDIALGPAQVAVNSTNIVVRLV